MEVRTEQLVEQEVAVAVVGRAAPEHEVALEIDPTGRSGGDAGVVALAPAAGDEAVGALRDRVDGERRELARLVAAEREAGQVVALDEQDGVGAEGLLQPLHPLHRRRAECDLPLVHQHGVLPDRWSRGAGDVTTPPRVPTDGDAGDRHHGAHCDRRSLGRNRHPVAEPDRMREVPDLPLAFVASRARSLSGLTATGWPTTDSIGTSVTESE